MLMLRLVQSSFYTVAVMVLVVVVGSGCGLWVVVVVVVVVVAVDVVVVVVVVVAVDVVVVGVVVVVAVVAGGGGGGHKGSLLCSFPSFAPPARSKDLSVPIPMTFLEVMVNFLPVSSNPGNLRSMPWFFRGKISYAVQAKLHLLHHLNQPCAFI